MPAFRKELGDERQADIRRAATRHGATSSAQARPSRSSIALAAVLRRLADRLEGAAAHERARTRAIAR